jgi:protein SCO1/2
VRSAITAAIIAEQGGGPPASLHSIEAGRVKLQARMSRIIGMGAVATAALTIGLSACGSSSSSSDSKQPSFAGLRAKPQVVAPPLQLRDSLGKEVNISDYRGKAVLVLFIYTHCPDICPLMVGHLHTALHELGSKASRVQIIAVSVDPKGDTPKTVKAFLRAHEMTGRMEYLIGSRPQLERTWKAWGIASKVDKSNPDLVEHSAEVVGISSRGKVTTLYPSNFKPQAIVHDVPLLASE